tara:strand:- start:526 stop:1002 length:477 start_codon:yes stop_codon:yes gene_type:complete
MNSNQIKEKFPFRKPNNFNQLGYSINEMVIVFSIVGILAGLLVPNFRNAIEFIEVLIAEKHLLKTVKDCEIGYINGDLNPQYSLPENEINLGNFKDNKFVFSYTGIGGDCAPEYGGNQLRVSRVNNNSETIIYSLIINVVTGEKISEGKIPDWLDWWD